MTGAESEQLRAEIVERLPNLRAFARSVAGDATKADDLVQETVVKALANLNSFRIGTNLTAWLFTILRNHFYSEVRRLWREVEDADGVHAGRLVSQPRQLDRMELNDFQAALATLPPEQREALILVGASGFAYEDAARICGCAVGTIKSRVNRARARLVELLDTDEGDKRLRPPRWPAPKRQAIARPREVSWQIGSATPSRLCEPGLSS